MKKKGGGGGGGVRAEVSGDCALVVLVPEEACGQIDAVRVTEDKGFAKWPAHMTLWFGFPFAGASETRERVARIAARVSPAKVRLTSVEREEGSKYVGAKGEGCEGLRRLREEVGKELGLGEGEEWRPHVTIAQRGAEESIEDLQREWQEVEFEVKEVHILQKDAKGRMRVEATIPLGGAAEEAKGTGAADKKKKAGKK